jgi:transketolase
MKLDKTTLPKNMRESILMMLYLSQSGHVGGSLSIVEMLVAIYSIADVSPDNPTRPDRDRIILSKGHACPALYAILAELAFFPKEDLWTLRQLDSHLQGHPDMLKTAGVDASTGSLGIGISMAVGCALALKRRGKGRVFCIIGDGEAQEGIVWEAAMAAGKYHLDNLCVLMDYNGLQIDGTVNDVMPIGNVVNHFTASGWDCHEVDGHDIEAIVGVLTAPGTNRPKFLLCTTTKGKGVSFMENKVMWHGKPFDKDILDAALLEVNGNHGE